ncbi:MAG: 4Fe-4S dicluster domain-containing protein [Spirochaetota bacterium]|nr:4Fe-4S dicluster domain-containing protein [Spirochaetota bacterium]
MKKWNLIIDISKCSDCNNCFLSNKDEYVDNDYPPYSVAQPKHGHRWINVMRKERGHGGLMDVAYMTLLCMHCDDAPCIKEANNGAVYKRRDGIVIIDPIKARGQKDIVSSCPYGVVYWNEEKQVAQKWIFDAHLLDAGWEEPRCVQSCYTGALRSLYVEDSEMQKIVKAEGLEVFHPEYNTRPRVYYKNFYLFNKCFIAGSIAYQHDGIADCAEGAKVALLQDSRLIDELVTDNFGDFKFDRLDENSGKYVLEILYKDYDKRTMDVDLKTSVYLGDIYL